MHSILIMQGDTTKLLSACIRSLTIIEFKLKDLFFRDTVRDIQSQLLSSFSRFKERSDDVAQYHALKDVHRDIDLALMVIKILGHFESGLTPLLLLETSKNFLSYKHEMMKYELSFGRNTVSKPKTETKPADIITKKIQIRKNTPLEVSETKKKIIAVIENNPKVRSKEIIDYLNSISVRTVKRNIKELVDEGLITRRSENKVIYYSIR